MDVIKSADWLVDMGPKVAKPEATSWRRGTPEEVASGRGEPHRALSPRLQCIIVCSGWGLCSPQPEQTMMHCEDIEES